MGISDFSVDGRSFASRRAYSVRKALTAVGCALGVVLAAPAFAQMETRPPIDWTKIDSYNTPPANLPSMQVPTNALKNAPSQAVEQNLLRRGFTPAQSASTALSIGGLGLTLAMQNSSNSLAASLTGAGLGGLVACGIGAVVGGGWNFGAGAVPGCAAGVLAGVQLGAIAGGVTYNLTADGSVKVDANGNLTGSSVRQSNQSLTSAKVSHIGFVSNAGPGASLVQDTGMTQAQFNAALTSVPINSSFVVRSGVDYYPALRLSMVYDTDGRWRIMGGSNITQCPADFGFYPTDFNASSYAAVCQTVSAGLPAGWAATSRYVQVRVNGTNPGCATGDVCTRQYQPNTVQTYYYVNFSQGYTSAASVPQIQYQPIVAVPLYQLGFGTSLDPNALQQPLDPAVAAKLYNYIWQQLGNNAPVPYDANNPVTPSDVLAAKTQLTLGDLVRPVANPEAQGGTAANPVSEPVTVANPSTGTGTGSSGSNTGTNANPTITQEKTDQDLDVGLTGILGDVTEPVRAFAAGAFNTFLHPVVNIPGASCPVITIDLPTLLGRSDQSRPADTQFLCDWYDQQRALFIGFLHVVYTIAFGMIVIRRAQ